MVDKKLVKVSAADGGRQIVASALPLILDPRPKTRGPACQMQIKQGGSRFKEVALGYVGESCLRMALLTSYDINCKRAQSYMS